MQKKTVKIILLSAYLIGFGVDFFIGSLPFNAILFVKIFALGMIAWSAYMLEFDKTIN